MLRSLVIGLLCWKQHLMHQSAQSGHSTRKLQFACRTSSTKRAIILSWKLTAKFSYPVTVDIVTDRHIASWLTVVHVQRREGRRLATNYTHQEREQWLTNLMLCPLLIYFITFSRRSVTHRYDHIWPAINCIFFRVCSFMRCQTLTGDRSQIQFSLQLVAVM